MDIKAEDGLLGTVENPYDIVISGAGPAGLSAGIVGGRYRKKVIIFEKESQASPFPRGETLHNARIFTEILGDNVLNLIARHITAARKFNSPKAENSLEIYRRTPSIVYRWSNFINLLLARLKETQTEISCNKEVVDLILQGNICNGVILADGSKIYATSTILADGHTSKVGRKIGIPYSKINNPIVKRLVSNFQGDYMGFEYFFLVPGMLDYAPRFPPAVIFVFPRGNKECEMGLMIFTDIAKQISDLCDIPDDEELLKVWHQLIETYPRFSNLMAGTTTDFEGISKIASAFVYDNPMPIPGLFLTGGAMGFVEHSGASGIASSMQIAKFAVDFLEDKKISAWNKSWQKKYVKEVRKTKFYSHILNNAKKTAQMKKFMFLRLKTAENINQKWGLIKAGYKLK